MTSAKPQDIAGVVGAVEFYELVILPPHPEGIEDGNTSSG